MANPYFNATYYLQQNPDLFAAGINTPEAAWAHYSNFGAGESIQGYSSRNPAPWFDGEYYFQTNPDLAAAGLSPVQVFEHFVNHGIAEGRSPSAAADAEVTVASLTAYADANEDLREAFGIEDGEAPTDAQLIQLAQHFYQYGYKEVRDGLPMDFTGNPGQTFTLTTGVDTWTGTHGDDIVQAIVGAAGDTTINTFDNIDGGAGRDTLNIAGAGNADIAANSTFENIEVVNIATTAAITNLNSNSFQDVEELWQVSAAGNVTVGEGVTAGFRDVIVAQTVTVADGVTAVSVALDDAGDTSTVTFAETTTGDLETVNVSGSVDSSDDGTADLTLTAVGTETTLALAVTSNSQIDASSFVDLVTLDASASTGNLQFVAAETAALVDLESVVGGSGNDTLEFDSSVLLAEAVSIDAGAGVDTITYTVDRAAAAIASSLTGGAGGDTFELASSSAEGNLFAVADNDDLLESLVTITDFDAGSDVLDISGLGGGSLTARTAQNTVNNAITAGGGETLFEVLGDVAAVVAADEYAVFAFEGNTYIYGDTASVGGLEAGDTLIQLAGVAVADLTAANFVA